MNETAKQKDSRAATPPKRQLKGTVVSDAMDKTVVVAVNRLRLHPYYKKRYRVTKRYKAHDEGNRYHVGDMVVIEETRPLSKGKRWRVTDNTQDASD